MGHEGGSAVEPGLRLGMMRHISTVIAPPFSHPAAMHFDTKGFG